MDQNLETFSLLWLDAAVRTSKENKKAQEKLRAIINHLEVFETIDECKKYIRRCSESDRIVLIVSGGLGREIVPQVTKYTQVDCIYVYCMDKKKNKEWASQHAKVRKTSFIHSCIFWRSFLLGEICRKQPQNSGRRNQIRPSYDRQS